MTSHQDILKLHLPQLFDNRICESHLLNTRTFIRWETNNTQLNSNNCEFTLLSTNKICRLTLLSRFFFETCSKKKRFF